MLYVLDSGCNMSALCFQQQCSDAFKQKSFYWITMFLWVRLGHDQKPAVENITGILEGSVRSISTAAYVLNTDLFFMVINKISGKWLLYINAFLLL